MGKHSKGQKQKPWYEMIINKAQRSAMKRLKGYYTFLPIKEKGIVEIVLSRRNHDTVKQLKEWGFGEKASQRLVFVKSLKNSISFK